MGKEGKRALQPKRNKGEVQRWVGGLGATSYLFERKCGFPLDVRRGGSKN